MEMEVVFFLALSTLAQLAEPLISSVAPYRAVAEIVSGDSRIFSGEGMRLRCSVPDAHMSNWHYRWFQGSESLGDGGQIFELWSARIDDTGKYSCQGVRNTVVGEVHTLQSLPVEILVDGGWALTRVRPQPALVGHSLEVTCLVRGKRLLSEVIFYRDGVEVMRNQDNNPKFSLSNLTLEDQGMYSCRASWEVNRQTHSVISAGTLGRVREVLSKPVLEINVTSNQISSRMKLICHHEYNLPAPAPPAHFYFYKNDKRLGTAKSENQLLVSRTPGWYHCKVRVPVLNLVRWSEPKAYGKIPVGQPALKLPVVQPRAWTSAPRDLIPNTQTRPSPQKPAGTPLLVYPQDVATRSQRSLEPATALPSATLPSPTLPSPTLPSTLPSLSQSAAPESDDSSEASGDMCEQSGDASDDDAP